MTAAYQLFNLPKSTPVNASSVVLSGSKLYFYATGTSTPQNTYSDSTLATPNSNPVIADANGLFGAIYLNPTLQYKITLTTSADVLVYTVDPVNDQVLSSAVIGGFLYPRTTDETTAVVTPTIYVPSLHLDIERYGGVADNTTDNAAAFTRAQAVLNTKGGGTILLPSDGTYLTNSQVVIPGSGCQYIGNGRWKTTIRYGGSAGAIFAVANTASANSYCRFQDFAIQLKQAGDYGIDATSLGLSKFDNIRIWGGSSFATRKGTGIRISAASASAYGNEFHGIDIQYCTNGVQISSVANEQHFFGGQINSCDAGLLMDGTGASVTDHVRLYGVRMENNAKAADIRDWRNLLFSGCRFEKNADGVYGVYYAGGSATDLPILLVGNGYHSYAGNEVVSNAAVGRVLQIGESPFDYQVNTGSGTRHVGLGTFVIGNPGTTGGATLQPEDSTGNAALNLSGQGNGAVKAVSGFVYSAATVAYSASMTPNAIAGNDFTITATNGVAFTINSPSNLAAAQTGQPITITIRNTSGGALGAATWNAAYKMSAWTQPANGFSRSITFTFDGSNLVQKWQTGVDVPN